MTHRQFYEYLLVELNTVKAPSLHLEDFLYLGNKGVQEYLNERYRKFAESMQLSDDLQALVKSTNVTINGLNVTYADGYTGTTAGANGFLYGSALYRFTLPDDYMHLLNCVTNIQTKLPYKCAAAGYVHGGGAKRLTSDLAANIMNNAFLKPDYRTTYYQIKDSTNANAPQGDIHILYGDPNKFSLNSLTLDYLKKPQPITMTPAERDAVIDPTPQLEFPDYVCNEIIKRTVKLILENQQNPRLQANNLINQSIE